MKIPVVYLFEAFIHLYKESSNYLSRINIGIDSKFKSIRKARLEALSTKRLFIRMLHIFRSFQIS